MTETQDVKGLEAAIAAVADSEGWNPEDMAITRQTAEAAIRAYLSALPAPDGELVERYAQRSEEMSEGGKYAWWAALADLLRGQASTILSLNQANEALMQERTSLIETKREQIERLTRERDEANSAASRWAQEASEASLLLAQSIEHQSRAEAAEAQVRNCREALDWYGEKAEALARYATHSPPQTSGMMAVVQTMALDGGQKARAALSSEGGDNG